MKQWHILGAIIGVIILAGAVAMVVKTPRQPAKPIANSMASVPMPLQQPAAVTTPPSAPAPAQPSVGTPAPATAQQLAPGKLPPPARPAMAPPVTAMVTKPGAPAAGTAQPAQNGPAGRPGGRGPRDPAMMARFALIGTFMGIGRLLREDSEAPLSPKQAKAILDIMAPLRSAKTLKPDQETQAQQQLLAQLTPAQQTVVNTRPARGQRGGFGGRGPGGGGNGGNGEQGNAERGPGPQSIPQTGAPTPPGNSAEGAPDRPGGDRGRAMAPARAVAAAAAVAAAG